MPSCKSFKIHARRGFHPVGIALGRERITAVTQRNNGAVELVEKIRVFLPRALDCVVVEKPPTSDAAKVFALDESAAKLARWERREEFPCLAFLFFSSECIKAEFDEFRGSIFPRAEFRYNR